MRPFFATCEAGDGASAVLAMQKLAAELKVHIPTSFFEADGPHYYNTLAMIGPTAAR
jgi:N-carbamoylputrescine amidase